MASFEFATASQILFGAGWLSRIGPLAAQAGQRVLVVNGRGAGMAGELFDILAQAGVQALEFEVPGEPTVELVQQGVDYARQERADLVIGFGGGSALDVGKAVAILLTNPGEVLDYLEVVGKGRALVPPPLPCFAVPTTAGTGAEVTRNAVLGVPEQQVKVSLRSAHMLPRLALIDPQLTYSLPPEVTASTGLDALTQLVEPYFSNRAMPLTDAICREGMPRAAGALRRVYENGQDAAAREQMCLASLFGGLALANARLGVVHGFAGVLGGLLQAPHGVICAGLLPFVLEANLRALQARQPDSPALARFDEVARLLTGNATATASQGIAWVQDLCQALQVPPLAAYGLRREHFPQVIEKSARASSMQGNPIVLSEAELGVILEQAI
ncbi:MAG: iron-containing alcohol dehydrogenase [Chloroflexota bacterium]